MSYISQGLHLGAGGELTADEIEAVQILGALGSPLQFLRTNAAGTAIEWAAVNSAVWGNITGTLSDQTDLQSALDAKLSVSAAASTYVPYTGATGNVHLGVNELTAGVLQSTGEYRVSGGNLYAFYEVGITFADPFFGLLSNEHAKIIFTDYVNYNWTFDFSGLDNDRTITWPNKSGTVAYLDDAISDHGALTGLSDDDHTIYALLLGRSGGQTLIGGTASGNSLTLQSSSHATKGKIIFGTSAYDEVNNWLGLGTAVPTHALTIPSTGIGIAIYNTVDQVTNYERASLTFSSSTFRFFTEAGGGGSTRNFELGASNGFLRVNTGGGANKFLFDRNIATTGNPIMGMQYNMSASSGIQGALSVTPTLNQSSTAGYVVFLGNVTETSTGSGAKYLLQGQISSVDQVLIGIRGNTVFNEAGNDADFRIEGDTDANCFFVDASTDRIGIGGATPGSKLDVLGSFQCDSITNDTGLAAGTYTPTRSAEANTDSNVTMSEAQYLRVGNTVTVSGRFTADPTTTLTTTSFEITLPVASNIGAVEDLAGVAFCGSIAAQGAEIIGVVANDTAKVQWIASDVTSQVWSYTFTYQVI